MAEEEKTNNTKNEEQQPRKRKDLRQYNSEWKFVRDIILFLGGLAGVAHETLFTAGSADPTLLLIFGAMMGLPAFLRNDEDKDGK